MKNVQKSFDDLRYDTFYFVDSVVTFSGRHYKTGEPLAKLVGFDNNRNPRPRTRVVRFYSPKSLDLGSRVVVAGRIRPDFTFLNNPDLDLFYGELVKVKGRVIGPFSINDLSKSSYGTDFSEYVTKVSSI